jgi:hypothetical protein
MPAVFAIRATVAAIQRWHHGITGETTTKLIQEIGQEMCLRIKSFPLTRIRELLGLFLSVDAVMPVLDPQHWRGFQR